jgi:hypothetical protein
MSTQNLLLVTVKYIGPTDYRGSRIKLTLPRFGEVKRISYNYEARDAEDGAVQFFASKGLAPVFRACGEDCAHLLFDFEHADSLIAIFGK